MDIRVHCATCGKSFFRTEDRMRESKKMHWNPYCSRECQYRAQERGKMLLCSRPKCTIRFYRRFKEINKVDKCYCSQSCAAIVNNQNKPKRVRKLKKCGVAECERMIPLSMIFCSKPCFTKAQTIFSDNELLEKIKTASKKLERTPAKRELGKIAYMCIRAFGSWNKALKKAGLEPQRSHSQRMFRRTHTIALDGHKCDSVSEALIDNWLTKHKILHTRDVSYPTTRHKADWGIGNKIFIEYFGLANDSPRYDRSIREKQRLCKKNGIQLVEIYPTDLYPNEKLDGKLIRTLATNQLI